MHIKKLNKTIAVLLAAAMIAPTSVSAAENTNNIEIQTEAPEAEEPQEEEQSQTPETEEPEPEVQEPENPEIEEPEQPQEPEPEVPEQPQEPETEVPEQPQTPEPETPEPEAPETEEPEQPQEPETPQEEEVPEKETPEQYEERTGFQLPDGKKYVLQDGFVILLEDGTPMLEDALTNEELIAQQVIQEPPAIQEDFRFWTVARVYAFAKEDISIREEMSEEAQAVGTLRKEGVCYVLETGEEWFYVESGTVRGFVKAEELFTGEEAETIYQKYQEKTGSRELEAEAGVAQELIPRGENQAFLHTRTTVNQTVVKKQYALASETVNIREGKGTDSRIVGVLEQNGLCYILADETEDWVYVESGNVRGFVSRSYLRTDESVQKQVEENGEATFTLAGEEISPQENQACYYTMTSIKSGVPGSTLRNLVLEFASQFIGNPYVWGGTSLTQGADCSGFVQSIYREFGYSLPRVAADQAQCGMKIAVEDAQPGDLIFYAKGGEIYHVVLYAGEGRTIEAMGTKYGIVSANLNTENAVWAVRLLEDAVTEYASEDLTEVNVPEENSGNDLGEFQIHYACTCEACSDGSTALEAVGTPLIEGETIAADPELIPAGAQVGIGGHLFTAAERYQEVTGKNITIFTNDHTKAEKVEHVYLMEG